jgi:uncharacterized secreted protein with C-terminal beta-propeller domain
MYYLFTQGDMMPGVATSQAVPEAAPADTSAWAGDFTGTNNQVADVDEADYVKNDGKFIYMLPKDTMESRLVISRHKFSNVLFTIALHVKCTRALTFENLSPGPSQSKIPG